MPPTQVTVQEVVARWVVEEAAKLGLYAIVRSGRKCWKTTVYVRPNNLPDPKRVSPWCYTVRCERESITVGKVQLKYADPCMLDQLLSEIVDRSGNGWG